MKLTLTFIAALTATTATAEGYKPPQEPKPQPPVIEQPETSSSGGIDILPLALVLLGVAIIASQSGQPDPDAPRPSVEPEPDYRKILELVE